MKWEQGESDCPKCGNRTEEAYESRTDSEGWENDCLVAERCTWCGWTIKVPKSA